MVHLPHNKRIVCCWCVYAFTNPSVSSLRLYIFIIAIDQEIYLNSTRVRWVSFSVAKSDALGFVRRGRCSTLPRSVCGQCSNGCFASFGVASEILGCSDMARFIDFKIWYLVQYKDNSIVWFYWSKVFFNEKKLKFLPRLKWPASSKYIYICMFKNWSLETIILASLAYMLLSSDMACFLILEMLSNSCILLV